MVFGIYDNVNGGPQLSRVSNILYQSTSKIIWALALGYIIYACVTANGGIFEKIFSLSFWTPLSRLSFSTYLIHILIVYLYIYNQEHPIHMQDINIVNINMYIYSYFTLNMNLYNILGVYLCGKLILFIYSWILF